MDQQRVGGGGGQPLLHVAWKIVGFCMLRNGAKRDNRLQHNKRPANCHKENDEPKTRTKLDCVAELVI